MSKDCKLEFPRKTKTDKFKFFVAVPFIVTGMVAILVWIFALIILFIIIGVPISMLAEKVERTYEVKP